MKIAKGQITYGFERNLKEMMELYLSQKEEKTSEQLEYLLNEKDKTILMFEINNKDLKIKNKELAGENKSLRAEIEVLTDELLWLRKLVEQLTDK